ncbi:hypothetical protein EVAR_39436_1 [Eumeta japonica]|uniref:Uncharacterized protein n=1 Tax=Eumeta variegata TaxID=151549 RepID=A0A4C1VZF8_EUMVA|nr:hypothetical protein EVAR_39436_1 [Eumeta japonica]
MKEKTGSGSTSINTKDEEFNSTSMLAELTKPALTKWASPVQERASYDTVSNTKPSILIGLALTKGNDDAGVLHSSYQKDYPNVLMVKKRNRNANRHDGYETINVRPKSSLEVTTPLGQSPPPRRPRLEARTKSPNATAAIMEDVYYFTPPSRGPRAPPARPRSCGALCRPALTLYHS